MQQLRWTRGGLALVALALVACGPAPAAAPQPAGQPAQSAPSASESKPAAPAPAAAPPAAAAKPTAAAVAPAETKPTAAAAAAPAGAKQIVFGTTSLSSAYGVYTAAVAKLLNARVPGVNVTLSEYGGAVANLGRARSGDIELSMADQIPLSMAATGELKGWETNPQKDLRLLWVFDPSVNAWVVNDRAGIEKIGDLAGKPFSPGGQGTTTETTSPLILDVLGIKPQWQRSSMDDMSGGFKERRIAGFVKASPIKRADAVIQDVMTAQPIRILPWPDDLVKTVQTKYPQFKTTQIPAGVYKGDWNKEPITSWGSSIVVWATTRLADDLGYQFTKAALEDKEIQVGAFPALKDYEIGKLTVEYGIVPLHKGALKALREAGHQIPKELVPPEA